tara:strand:- start:474 stop:1817 length:1344 start_codon:yes stop_codon:yes gene_type:complete
MSEEKPEEQTEEVEETEDDPFAKVQWTPDPPVSSPQDSVNSAGLYADTLRKGAGVDDWELPAWRVDPETEGMPRDKWLQHIGPELPKPIPWSAIGEHPVRKERTDQLLNQIENFDDEALGFKDPSRPTGYKPGSVSDKVARMRRISPKDLRKAMKKRIEEIAKTPKSDIPTMDEIRDEEHLKLRRELPRLSESYSDYDKQFQLTHQTLADDPFSPEVPKYGKARPGFGYDSYGAQNKIVETATNLTKALFGMAGGSPGDPILLYDPVKQHKKKKRHTKSHQVLDRAVESPGYQDAFPIHQFQLQEKLRKGKLPVISNEDMEDAVRKTLTRFTANFHALGKLEAPIESPGGRGEKGRKPTSDSWPESVRNLYSSTQGEMGDSLKTIGPALHWTEELAFLNALQQVQAQLNAIEGTPVDKKQAEALLKSLESTMRKQKAEKERKKHGGQ